MARRLARKPRTRREGPGDTVVFLGAGATAACGGPLTNQILPYVFDNAAVPVFQREEFLRTLTSFLRDAFWRGQQRGPMPSLTVLLSILDMAIDRKHAFGAKWTHGELAKVREALEYVIFASLEYALSKPHPDEKLQLDLFRSVGDANRHVNVVTTNYDIIADNSLIELSNHFPDYHCGIATADYASAPKRGSLVKLHGSLNWLYCPNCQRMDLGLSRSGTRTIKVLDQLYREHERRKLTLEQRYACSGSPCASCKTSVRPVMISPTFQKDFRNPHLTSIWLAAERVLREARRVIFVGYSLPDDDIHVTYLLKRTLGHLAPKALTVVELDRRTPEAMAKELHPTHTRFAAMFGEGIDWQPDGFKKWLGRGRI